MVDALENDVTRTISVLRDGRLSECQDVGKVHSREKTRAETCCTPVEPQTLLDDVLLLPSVPSADERDGQGNDLELGLEIGDGEREGVLHETGGISGRQKRQLRRLEEGRRRVEWMTFESERRRIARERKTYPKTSHRQSLRRSPSTSGQVPCERT